MPRAKENEIRAVCRNKSAFHDYFIEERFEAGLVLVGSEVKSLREGRADLKDAYGLIEGGEAFLVHMRISEWTGGTYFNHKPERRRKLLLHRKQIQKLKILIDQRGYALIPLRVYFNEKNRAKVELAVARGKRKYDKREAIRERDERRAAQREGDRH